MFSNRTFIIKIIPRDEVNLYLLVSLLCLSFLRYWDILRHCLISFLLLCILMYGLSLAQQIHFYIIAGWSNFSIDLPGLTLLEILVPFLLHKQIWALSLLFQTLFVFLQVLFVSRPVPLYGNADDCSCVILMYLDTFDIFALDQRNHVQNHVSSLFATWRDQTIIQNLPYLPC